MQSHASLGSLSLFWLAVIELSGCRCYLSELKSSKVYLNVWLPPPTRWGDNVPSREDSPLPPFCSQLSSEPFQKHLTSAGSQNLSLGCEICSRQRSNFSFCLNGRVRLKEKNGCIEHRRQNCASPQSGLAVNFSSRGTLSLSTWQTGPGCLSPVWAVGQDEWLDSALVIGRQGSYSFPPCFIRKYRLSFHWVFA